MSADDSVAQFIRRVHCSMDRLGQIWDRVGMDQKTRDCKTQTAYIHFCTLLDDIVKAEEDMASGVASNIGAHRLALNALDKEVSILSELKDKAVASQVQQHQIVKQLCFQLDIDSPVCNDISLKIMPESNLEELENRRKELSNQVKQRVNTAVNLQTICRKMYKPMLKSVTISAEQENLLNTDFTGPLAIISDKVLQELRELHKYLETEYTSWLDQISIQYAKLMVQLKEFSAKCICLNQYSQLYPDRFDIEHQSEEDLAKLAAEVDRLKKRYHKGQPVFDHLSRWLVLWQEKLELDDHACNSQKQVAVAQVFEELKHSVQIYLEDEGRISEPLAKAKNETGQEATLEKGRDNRMTEFSKNPEEAKQISNKIYSSTFCHLIRTSIHELKHVGCPMTEAQLQELGIDLAGISANTISTNKNNRPPDCMRYHNKTFTERNSIQRNKRPNRRDQPERGGNAWKSKKDTKEIKDDDEARHHNVKKEVRGFLNKMTPSTYEVMVRQFCDFKVHTDPKLLPIITTLIFEKAVEDQMFCPLYSDLCLKQVELESKLDAEQRPPISFSSSIIKKCQETFLCAIRSDDLIKQLEKERATEKTEDSKKSVTEKIDLLKTKKKRTLLGIIQFIAQLYRHNLLIDWIINWCVVELFKRYDKTTDEMYIEYAVKMIETVGPTYHKKRLLAQKQSTAAAADAEVPYIEKIVAQLSSIKSSLTNKLKFMIMNLDELCKNNWQTKHDSRRLTTLENREDDPEQKQLENEQNRYHRKTSHYGYKKGCSFNYPDSAFIDDNDSILAPQSTDRRAADARASSQTGTASVREGTNLIKDDGRLGRLPNIWKSYGAVPTALVTPPSNADSTTKRHHLHSELLVLLTNTFTILKNSTFSYRVLLFIVYRN